MHGCMEMLEISVHNIMTWVHAFVIIDAPFRLLLGRPWQCLVHMSKIEDDKGIHVTIQDPANSSNLQRISTTQHPSQDFLGSFSLISITHIVQQTSTTKQMEKESPNLRTHGTRILFSLNTTEAVLLSSQVHPIPHANLVIYTPGQLNKTEMLPANKSTLKNHQAPTAVIKSQHNHKTTNNNIIPRHSK